MVDCVATPGAIANSLDPAYCAMGTTDNDNTAIEAGVINAVFDPVLGPTADPFFCIGKYGKQDGIQDPVAGFSLTASSGFICGVQDIPEPGVLFLLETGLIGFVLVRRRIA